LYTVIVFVVTPACLEVRIASYGSIHSWKFQPLPSRYFRNWRTDRPIFAAGIRYLLLQGKYEFRFYMLIARSMNVGSGLTEMHCISISPTVNQYKIYLPEPSVILASSTWSSRILSNYILFKDAVILLKPNAPQHIFKRT
jgi:hypothetical protein